MIRKECAIRVAHSFATTSLQTPVCKDVVQIILGDAYSPEFFGSISSLDFEWAFICFLENPKCCLHG